MSFSLLHQALCGIYHSAPAVFPRYDYPLYTREFPEPFWQQRFIFHTQPALVLFEL
jgi:hypothetical protein